MQFQSPQFQSTIEKVTKKEETHLSVSPFAENQ
jgi:hypothetical protein